MSQALIEFLEVIINQILFLRGVYPSQIFKKLKFCSLPVFVSLYPPLNNYLRNVLLEAKTLLKAKKLIKIEIRLLKNDKPHESFFVDINSANPTEKLDDDLKTEFRSCIHSLDRKCKVMKKLTRNCRFKILLHVKSYDYKSDSMCQDFLWIEDNESSEAGEIIPINMSSKSNAVKFYIER